MPAVILPPGEFMYKEISLEGSIDDKYNNSATTKEDVASFISPFKTIILSFNSKEKIS